ncbi:MAG: zinc-dependent metalloprotease [Ferruginibacter sp.]
MKKIYLLALLLVVGGSSVFAQTDNLLQDGESFKKCGTAEVLENLRRANPGGIETTEHFEAWLQQKVAERRANPLGRGVSPQVTLPVVFHIIHSGQAVGTTLNVSQAAIRQQVLQLNKDFANLSNSPYAVAESMGIQFALAQTNPSGTTLAEPGIDRILYSDKGFTLPPYTVGYASAAANYLTNTIKPATIWDPERYLNIWISDWESGILGIATFPTSSGLSGLSASETASTAGVAVAYASIGSIFSPQGGCTAVYGKGRTLTHELGHFFGLRHIWGDGVCATDYCNDTPTHQTSNSGEPTHPKPNSCGTADEMFENYMDYCYDIVSNTFTINQADRMEAVMANSPRRVNLATSTVGLVAVTASNQLAFADCDGALQVSEASGMTACPRYRDVRLYLNVEDKATAAATVNLTLGGTAVLNKDYQLLTPTALSFATGDNYKAITVRIIDDGVATGNKTITFSYTITGTGVTAGTTGQTYTLTIIDDDAVRQVNNTNPAITIFSENFGTTANGGLLPTGWLKGSFTAGANVFTVNSQYGAATGFTAADGRALHITNGSTADQTSEIAANTYTMTSTTNYIAMTPSINTVGYKNIKLTFDYACAGELIGSTLNDFGRLRYSITAQSSGITVLTNTAGTPYYFYNTTNKTSVTITLPESLEGQSNLWLGFEWYNNANGTGTAPPFIIDNIVITGDALGVETVLNQTSTTSQNVSETAQYSSSNKIIATIANPSVNLGCVTATVTSAGTGLATLTTNAGSYQRSDKVIQLTPATANTTATYQATFYYTTAELAAWGANVPNLKILKVTDGVSLTSTLTNSNSAIFTPVVNDQRSTAGYVSFTINATGGFSQFLLVSQNIVLPINLLTFEARPNGKNILLNWSTATEINNKGFVIERSTDGTRFESIGWVDGAINSSRTINYTYSDNFVQPDQLYYYRLRQTDLDGRETLSEIRSAKIKGDKALQLTISPNPAKGQLRVFTAGGSVTSDISLLDAKGRLVRSWRKVNASAAPYLLDISNIADGVYMIKVASGDTIVTEKLVIHQ